jgi:hypothetical protein
MKKAKILKVVGLVILILIVSIVLIVKMFGNTLIKSGIETAATQTLQVGVTIDDLDFSILGGKVEFEGLVVDNPPGYEHETLLNVGKARVAVSIGSLMKDTINIREIMFDGIEVTLEQKGLTNNIGDILKNLPEDEEAEPEPEPEEKEAKPSKKLHIDRLEIRNVVVNAKLLPIPGKDDTIKIRLDPIIMTDLGGDNKLDIAKLVAKILTAIATGVAKQGAGLLPEDVIGSMEESLGIISEKGKAIIEELEEATESGKGVLESLKGIFEKKE